MESEREEVEQWKKVTAVLMHKLGLNEVSLNLDDLNGYLSSDHHCLAYMGDGDNFHLKLVTRDEMALINMGNNTGTRS